MYPKKKMKNYNNCNVKIHYSDIKTPYFNFKIFHKKLI